MNTMMRWIGIVVMALLCVPLLSGCQIAQVAAQNAKPASSPERQRRRCREARRPPVRHRLGAFVGRQLLATHF